MHTLLIYLALNFVVIGCHEAKDFDDTILYRVSWQDIPELDESKFETIAMTTHQNEQYECKIPIHQEKKLVTTMDDALQALNVIEQFFSLTSCSYRVESYWTYEVCHGHHVKQYHEERDGKHVKLQEYYLGKWSDELMEKLKKTLDDDIKAGNKLKTVKIDNVVHPYIELEMSDGSLCELNNEPRMTKLRYVCHPHGKNELYSIKETSSCNYEAIVLMTILCISESLKPDEATDSIIKCSPLNNSPEVPLTWLNNEISRLKAIKPFDKYGILFENGMSDEKITNIVLPEAIGESPAINDPSIKTSTHKSLVSKPVSEQNIIKEILAGTRCLTGGTAWWRYEFCYGKSVRQYHVDKDGETSLVLGYFDKDLHRKWINVNPDKRPKPKKDRLEVSQLYQGGTVCDKTGNTRVTEVKLRCLPTGTAITKVMMYLLEPTTCQYILVVESPIMCDILLILDDYGLEPPPITLENIDSKETIKTESDLVQKTPLEELEVPLGID